MLSGRTVTKEQKQFHDALATHVGCIACRKAGNHNNWVSIHHIDGRTKDHAHWYVLPLCAGHHQEGTGNQLLKGWAIHPYKARFEKRYGTQHQLYIECLHLLAKNHCPLPEGLKTWIRENQ
ncbi:Ref family recombination enhancement nuclease [Spartinivicinus ruber]|uniref:Ref family recombination enhancement nuclease n=1 Tax=Spartinivicinus ruber TaxID=2683272 RepID=UPI0013CF71B4|nr:Ref family recombination enhancement nuclease [Spartinivicinus ruber]